MLCRWLPLALLGFAFVAFSAPASAQSNLALATIVAPNAGNSTTTDLSTIVMTGTDLPIAPDADMGKEENTDFVSVIDNTDGWTAGYGTGSSFFGRNCYVTVGASTSTELILSVGNQGAFCVSRFVHAGDNITVTLVDGSGNALGSASATAVANPSAGTGSVTVPVVSGVTPATGPAAGGTTDAPGSGSVTVNTGSASTPEAFWFGGYTITAGWYGVATTNFTPTGTPGVFNVVPPAYVFGSTTPQNFGVSVFSADSTFGMSDQNCTVEITGCADEYFYTNSYSGSTSLSFDPPLNWSEGLATKGTVGSSSCGVGSSSGTSTGLSVGGSLAGGPLTVNGGVSVSDSNSGIPEAFIGNASLVVASPLTITVTLTGGVSGCEQIPIPDLSIPDVGGLYFQVGGSISVNVSLTITINAGTYGVTGGWIPGGAPFANFIENCTDADGNPTSDCITTQLTASLVGAVSISPLWLQLGPPQANVGAGLTAAAIAQGSITVNPPAPPVFNGGGDICVAGNWDAQINIGDFNASKSGNYLGPFNIVGDGSLCPMGQTAGATAPGAPATPAATPGDGTATVTWSPPASDGGSAITGYNVYEGTTAGGESTTPLNATPLSPDTTSFPVSGLTNGTTYFFTVTAVNAIGEGPASGEVSATPVSAGTTPTAPGAPTAPAVTAGDASATVAWSPPASDGGSAVTGYNVYQGTSPGGESTTPINSTPLSPTAASDLVTGLTDGTTYYFTVTAVNAVGEGPPSAEVSATPTATAGPTVPGAPTAPVATAGDGSATVTWAPPDSDGGSPITGYNVYAGPTTGSESTTPLNPAPLSATAASYLTSTLTNGTPYFFTITAVNAVGEGGPSAEVTATPKHSAGPTVPTPPVSLGATAGDGSATVTWSPPATDGGSPITGYNVYDGTTAGGESTTPVNPSPLSASASTDLVSSLTNATAYFFTITAVNAVGESGPSAEVSATPAPLSGATAPGAPSGLRAKGGDHTAALRWNPPASDGGSDITGYNVVKRCGDERAKLVNHHPLPADSYAYLVTHLMNGTRCRFTVKAVNAVGVGPASKPATATPHHPTMYVSAAPADLHAKAGDRTVTLTWKPPASNGGSAITGYDVVERGGNGPAVLVNPVPLGASDTSYVVRHLVDGSGYRFTVKAINAVGVGPASKPATATPHQVVNQYPPGPVRQLAATAADHAVTLTWKPPVSATGRAVTGYDVYVSNRPDQHFGRPVNVRPLPASAITAQVTKLTNGRSYYFTVQAVNADGLGAIAKSVPVIPSAFPPPVPTTPSKTVNATAPAVIPLPRIRNLLLLTA